jgi:hypothetical protein
LFHELNCPPKWVRSDNASALNRPRQESNLGEKMGVMIAIQIAVNQSVSDMPAPNPEVNIGSARRVE